LKQLLLHLVVVVVQLLLLPHYCQAHFHSRLAEEADSKANRFYLLEGLQL
jgi:hypothetical protein